MRSLPPVLKSCQESGTSSRWAAARAVWESTLRVNLAFALQQLGGRIGLVDADVLASEIAPGIQKRESPNSDESIAFDRDVTSESSRTSNHWLRAPSPRRPQPRRPW